MKAMLVQPMYFPWIGLFDMMDQCDLFIFYDDAQYVKQSWQSRNRIKTPNGVKWISIDIDRSYRLGDKIGEILTHSSHRWKTRHLNQINEAYKKTRYFDGYFPLLENMITQSGNGLADISAGSTRFAAEILGIETPLRSSSEFNVNGLRGAEKVAEICRAAGADRYLDGETGRCLYDPSAFAAKGIEIEFHEYAHPAYRQPYGDFVSHLSVLDLIFNEGPDALRMIRNGRTAVPSDALMR